MPFIPVSDAASKRRRASPQRTAHPPCCLAHKWKGASSEDADEKLFTADFLACFGLAAHQYKREYAVPKQDGSTGYMDGFIPGSLIIEGKSLGKDLKKARAGPAYRWGCAPHEQPRYVLLHDFERFALFDLSQDTQHPTTWPLPAHADWFRFLVDAERAVIVEETSRPAHSMAQLHEALQRSHFTGKATGNLPHPPAVLFLPRFHLWQQPPVQRW